MKFPIRNFISKCDQIHRKLVTFTGEILNGKLLFLCSGTLCNGYEMGGFKNIDLRIKITSIQCSWAKILFEDGFHDRKTIPLFLIGKYLGKTFKFHNNIDINNEILSKFPSFYQDIFIKWIKSYTAKPTLPSMILSEFIWFKVGSKSVHFLFFSDKNLNYKWKYKALGRYKNRISSWLQIIDTLPKSWKNIIFKGKGKTKNSKKFPNL